MLKLMIVEKDKNGNITLTPEKLEEMLIEAYETGKKESISIPTVSPYKITTTPNITSTISSGEDVVKKYPVSYISNNADSLV